MTNFRNKFRVESTRLPGYDYTRNGAYFITICTKNRQWLFGDIIDDKLDNGDKLDTNPVSNHFIDPNHDPNPNHFKPGTNHSINIRLSDFGKIVNECWYDLPNHYSNIILDEFIIMPNHIHGIIIIRNPTWQKQKHGISEFMRAFKSFSARRIHESGNTNRQEIWQPRFYDHIIKSENELSRIRIYIKNNPYKMIQNRSIQ